jgi:hypothetical protein
VRPPARHASRFPLPAPRTERIQRSRGKVGLPPGAIGVGGFLLFLDLGKGRRGKVAVHLRLLQLSAPPVRRFDLELIGCGSL